MKKDTQKKLRSFIVKRYNSVPTDSELTELKTICIERTNKAKHNHSTKDKATALRYYLIGLNVYEISKILDISDKTLEKWKINENWYKYKNETPIFEVVYNLSQSGKSYNEIAELLNLHPKTIYNYMKLYKLKLDS
jgi:transposase